MEMAGTLGFVVLSRDTGREAEDESANDNHCKSRAARSSFMWNGNTCSVVVVYLEGWL
jgi:hypothetical protein